MRWKYLFPLEKIVFTVYCLLSLLIDGYLLMGFYFWNYLNLSKESRFFSPVPAN